MVSLKSKHDIDTMREACKITGMTLNEIEKIIKPGITTKEISDFAEEFILSHGGKPSFKNYRGFPAAACVSVNDVVVHGIPNKLKLQDGDIVSVDILLFISKPDWYCVEYFPVSGDFSVTYKR